MTQHRLHSDGGTTVVLSDPYVAQSERRGSKRTFVDLTLNLPDLGEVVVSLDQENLLLRVAEATGSLITRPKAPAVYDGRKA